MTEPDNSQSDADKRHFERSNAARCKVTPDLDEFVRSGQPTIDMYLDQFGPLVGSPYLWKVLGYRTPNSFHQAAKRAQVPVRLVTVVHRKGYFAFTTDIRVWLRQLATCDEGVGHAVAARGGEPM